MKVFIVLSVLVAAVSASYLPTGPGPLIGAPIAASPVAAISTGQSSQFRSEDDHGNFQFGYDEAHATGSTSRREEGGPGFRRGSYSLSDADGRRRTVNYVADHTGFHAAVQTNEPGVEPKDSADVLINKAPVAIAAPAPIAAPLPAPIAAQAYAPIPEAPLPRAFSYAFGSSHINPSPLPGLAY